MLAAYPFSRVVPAALVGAFVVASTSAGCSRPSSTLATPEPVTTTLLTRLGTDTVSIEEYSRTATHIEGTVLSRMPSTRLASYSVQLGAGGAPISANLTVRSAGGTPMTGGLQSLSARFDRDTVRIVGHRSTGDTAVAVPVRGAAMPMIDGSSALYELAFARLGATGRDSMSFAAVPLTLAGTQAIPISVSVVGPDSARIRLFGMPFYAKHDARGALVGLDGSRTTLKVRVERVPTVDLHAVAQEWASRDRSSGAAGIPSPRDTVRADVGAAHLWIDYGRPALRGRDVWQRGVLGDTLWRTGANAATQLHTDADLLIGGAAVPAGTYTLWTATSGGSYRLVVNRQFGQWGTVYDAARDLVRVPLRESVTTTPAERFTIDVAPQGAGSATLELTWGTKRLSVPIAAK
ncbi:MAG TPA: DUF2911 domain-containing protein [Gemmatimonadaceae bacterium]|jgi:hypothetical protein|nr:DUF2911 domain-containing protein [Gemmatimonadaceae bacterium]